MALPGISFQSKELEQLLDMIDQLRAQGISRFIDLPQMIVCGDQSSGKSSVLEAVSGVRFPTKDNLCTRFPTELILRRSPETFVSISIVPDAGRTDEEKTRLHTFKAGPEALGDFGATVDAAGRAMGLHRESRVFSNDVLRVELTGPRLPHLTLVDLPGLFHAGNKNQSDKDAEAVKALVTKYMAKPRSVILAVVSAKNDYANQIVTKYAKDVDPTGDRTIGIITKPDTLHPGSESEKQFFELAENKDVVLRLGWHVLKNRDFDTKDCSMKERDQAEAAFFAKGIWSSLRPTQMGIGSLKPRLSRLLRDQILSELPGLIADAKAGIADCEARLQRLGVPRATKSDQRIYLHSVSQSFCKIVRDAVAGYYQEEYFQSKGDTDGFAKRVRAVVFNRLDQFRAETEAHGHRYQVIPDNAERSERQQANVTFSSRLFNSSRSGQSRPSLERHRDMESDEDAGHKAYPIPVIRSTRLLEIKGLIKSHRGLELPGLSKHEIITTLFRKQCDPWKDIIKNYAQKIFEDVRVALYLALDKASDPTTRDAILRFIINPALNDVKADVDVRVSQNLKQHVSGQPITFNQYFTDNVQKLRQDHHAEYLQSRLLAYFGEDTSQLHETKEHRFAVADLAERLTQGTKEDSLEFTCSEALYYMEAYYEVARRFFVDDFSVHTIEQGLLETLEGIFNPSKVLTLDDEIIEEIAGETDESQIERESSTTKLTALRKALDVLHRLDRSHAKGQSSKNQVGGGEQLV